MSGFRIFCDDDGRCAFPRGFCNISVDRIYIMRTNGCSKRRAKKDHNVSGKCRSIRLPFLDQDPGVYKFEEEGSMILS